MISTNRKYLFKLLYSILFRCTRRLSKSKRIKLICYVQIWLKPSQNNKAQSYSKQRTAKRLLRHFRRILVSLAASTFTFQKTTDLSNVQGFDNLLYLDGVANRLQLVKIVKTWNRLNSRAALISFTAQHFRFLANVNEALDRRVNNSNMTNATQEGEIIQIHVGDERMARPMD